MVVRRSKRVTFVLVLYFGGSGVSALSTRLGSCEPVRAPDWNLISPLGDPRRLEVVSKCNPLEVQQIL